MKPAARILVVDDNRGFRISTTALLRQDGYEVVAVESGEQALEASRAARFDLLLVDLRMPDMDGFSLVRLLRRVGERAPILIVSAFGSAATSGLALRLGADDFLTKPFEPERLSARITGLLGS